MFDATVASATVSEGYVPRQDGDYAANTTQEITIPISDTREYMLASERALAAIWMTPDEDEAWKDL